MNADDCILKLSHVSLKGKDVLPEYSGIYYVIDDKYVIWYVGQAKNLRTRWTGKNHHRFYQLQKQRKKQFTIYYEPGVESLLDVTEQQRIEQYNPQLNGTRVKTKKLRATETLLRETLFVLAPYSFILGVESPRKEDPKLIEDSIYWRNEWRVQKAVLPLKVIHVCVNVKELEDFVKDYLLMDRFLRKVFRKRSNYSDNWICKPTEKSKRWDILPLRRLLVNGFAIEVYKAQEEAIKNIQGYKLTQLAGVNIKAVNEETLVDIGVSLPTFMQLMPCPCKSTERV